MTVKVKKLITILFMTLISYTYPTMKAFNLVPFPCYKSWFPMINFVNKVKPKLDHSLYVGKLFISGNGKMQDYNYNEFPPWVSSSIKSIIIEDGVTSIGDNAFSGRTALESTTNFKRLLEIIPSVHYYQFSGCKNLTTVIIPDTVVSIGKRAFQNCAKLASLEIPSSVNSIKDMAFSGCSGLTSLTYLGENDPGAFSDSVFSHCDKLEYVSVSDNYKDDYFCGKPVKHTLASGRCGQTVHWLLNKNTGSFTISGEGSIVNYELYDQMPWASYKNLIKFIEIKEGVTSIGDKAFSNCENLQSVVISDDVEFIGNEAFLGCSNLNSVTYLGRDDPGTSSKNVFKDCDNLISTSVTHGYKSNKFCDVPIAPLIDDLSLVAIVKNEAPYIKEWIEFHKLVGVTKFYIYDNESTDNLKEILKDYIESGEVIYKYFPGKMQQVIAYQEAINNYKYKTKYMGFIDIDEFIVPTQKEKIIDTIEDIVKENKKIAGIAINWLCYGSSGFVDKPKGLVTENFKYRSLNNFHRNALIKTICNPRNILTMLHVHHPIFKKGYYLVNENSEKIPSSPWNYNCLYKKLRINHYFTKSKSEFIEKADKGRADMPFKRPVGEFYEKDKNDVYDYIMEKYVDKLKSKLNFD